MIVRKAICLRKIFEDMKEGLSSSETDIENNYFYIR